MTRSASRHSRSAPARGEPDRILRFRRSERLVHWSIAIPFMICYATALARFALYHASSAAPYREMLSWAHRLSGLFLFALPTLVLVRNRADFRVHLDNVRQAWIWTLADVKWLALMGLAAVSRRFSLPEQGKFNAAEKLNFMMVMATWPLYIVTGILVWLPGVAFVAWILHVFMAFAATPLMLGHIFMATVNRGTRAGLSGMISGFVDRQWAKHHYRRWYRERFEDRVPGDRAPATLITCPACRREHAAASLESLLHGMFSAKPISCSHCRTTIDVLSVSSEPHDVEWILLQLDAAASRADSARTRRVVSHAPEKATTRPVPRGIL